MSEQDAGRPLEQEAREWLSNHGNSQLSAFADLFVSFAAPLRSQLTEAQKELMELRKLHQNQADSIGNYCKLLSAAKNSGVSLMWDGPEVIASNERAEAAEQQVEQLMAVPEVSMQAMINAGLNGFAIELVSESLAGKQDIKTFKPFRFSYRGVTYTFAPTVPGRESV